ncbi:MAG TPA: NADH-quinone oxidoreductase subunit C [Acidimicrobiia bacterium]
MTSNQSETLEETVAAPATDQAIDLDPLADLAATVAAAVGGQATFAFGTAKVRVPVSSWTESLRIARDDHALVFFSWLSAIDWSNQVEVGDALTETVEERIELLAAVGDLTSGNLIIFSTNLDKESPVVESLVGIYPGANWHEREAHEMFGIEFRGHPQLQKLYLPDGFLGNPLRKSFPLLTREVKPWPGKVDVEGLPGAGDDDGGPSEENPEA